MISYQVFFETLQRKKLSQNKLLQDKVITAPILQRMRSNGNVRIDTIDKLCNYLQVTPDQVFTWYPDTATNFITARTDPTPEELDDGSINPDTVQDSPPANTADYSKQLQELQQQINNLKKQIENK